MRTFLLILVTAVTLYIAYYLKTYYNLFQPRSSSIVIVPPSSPVPTKVAPLAVMPSMTAPTAAPAAKVAPLPIAAGSNDRLIELLRRMEHDNTAQEAVALLMTDSVSAEERRTLETAVLQKFHGRLAETLEPYLNEANQPPTVLIHALHLAVSDGGVETARLIADKLRASDPALRKAAVGAIANADPTHLQNAGNDLLFPPLLELLQNADDAPENLPRASANLIDKLSETEKRQWFELGIEAAKQADSNGVLLKEFAETLKRDAYLKTLVTEQLQQPALDPTLKSFLEKSVAAPTKPATTSEQP